MNGFDSIVTWLEANVKMHGKRRTTLAYLVSAAMMVRGLGVLALGRAMKSETTAKHAIKRVWRFFKNVDVECTAVHEAIFREFTPEDGPIIVLVDWTDLYPYTQLVFALPRDGRALPFLSKTIYKEGGEGSRIAAETWALETFASFCLKDRQVIFVADRGFGNQRWTHNIDARGWHYVQRLPRSFNVEVEEYVGNLFAMRFRRRQRPRDYGWGLIGDKAEHESRLVVQYAKDYDEPWFLATNLKEDFASVIVRYYQRRMWIEAMFRDWKNRQWGMGLNAVRLSEPERHDRLFLVVALAYVFLCACGAYAEKTGLGEALKANTARIRVMTLLRMGVQLLWRKTPTRRQAISALAELPS